MPTIYAINFDGQIVPKARARVTKNGTFQPKKYNQWKRNAKQKYFSVSLQEQWPTPFPPGMMIMVVLTGKHSRRGDLDNQVGSVLDALVQGEVLAEDNGVKVNCNFALLDYDPKQPPQYWVGLVETGTRKTLMESLQLFLDYTDTSQDAEILPIQRTSQAA